MNREPGCINKSFLQVIAQAINIDNKSHSVSTVLDAIKETIMDWVPIRARQSAMFRRCKKKGLMGRKEENIQMVTQDLLFELTRSG